MEPESKGFLAIMKTAAFNAYLAHFSDRTDAIIFKAGMIKTGINPKAIEIWDLDTAEMIRRDDEGKKKPK
jgi:hypothetical protein